MTLGLLVALPLVLCFQKPSAKAWTGAWMTTFGPLTLEAKGSTVAGRYGWGEEGELDGKLERNRLVFSWNSPFARGEGWFELWKDGRTFAGESSFPGGKEFWGGYCREARSARPEPGKITDGQTAAGLEYHLRTPQGFDPRERTTAVALFHGSNTNSRDYVEGFPSNWPALGERYILVGFDGEQLSPASREPVRAFNASYVNFSGHQVGEPWRFNQTPWLVAQGLDQLARELPIDRWFIGGHSQGGFLTLAVALFYPEHIAGAFEVAGNLLVQCEPERFTDENLRAAQRRVPIALVHGDRDAVVEYSAATYTRDALEDGGFSMVRLFPGKELGHPWAFLPVDEALVWLEGLTSTRPPELLAFAAVAVEEQRWRDAGAALERLRGLAASATELARAQELGARLDDAARKEAGPLKAQILADADDGWVDAFWEFRSRFAQAPSAGEVLAAYDRARARQERPAEELFLRARGLEDSEARAELLREIVAKHHASSYYRLAKSWLEPRRP